MDFNRLIPELSASHFEKSISFYIDVLGFQIKYQRSENQFAFLAYQGSQIMLSQRNGTWETGELAYPFGRGINIQMLVDDIEVIIRSLKEHGYPLMIEPEEHWYRKDDLLLGLREFLVMDPDGYLLRFSQQVGIRPREKVIELD
ncbi:MAG TPA: VOC family protein [Ktedonobacteraceae bacterium]|nr:VOC family protein [Ktedonobacteraceae bacterium]